MCGLFFSQELYHLTGCTVWSSRFSQTGQHTLITSKLSFTLCTSGQNPLKLTAQTLGIHLVGNQFGHHFITGNQVYQRHKGYLQKKFPQLRNEFSTSGIVADNLRHTE